MEDKTNTGMVELTVSGSFRTEPGSDRGRTPFANVKIVVPRCPDKVKDKQNMYYTFATRNFPLARQSDKVLSKINYEGLIKIYIDDIKPVDGTPACLGKNIKEMNWQEIQHMACCLALREIPIYQSCNLREAREKAYETYMKVIKKKKVIDSDLDMKEIEETVRRKFERAGLTNDELEEEISKAKQDTFDKRENIHNPAMSYNFIKLPAIIAVKEWGEKASTTE